MFVCFFVFFLFSFVVDSLLTISNSLYLDECHQKNRVPGWDFNECWPQVVGLKGADSDRKLVAPFLRIF